MTPLEEEIAAEIRAGGPITFRRFMELALYHPEHGYYQRPRDPFGIEGDFYTNSQLQPVFGRLLARQVEQWYDEMGAPADFIVVEMGAGRGETSAEIQRCLPAVRCITVDVSSGEPPEKFSGVVICNEFFDALPVHSIERRGEALVEHYVAGNSCQAGDKNYDNQNQSRVRQQAVSASTRSSNSGQRSSFGCGRSALGEGGFEWAAGELSDPRLQDYADRFTHGLAEGQRIEANLDALEQLERIASSLEAGYVITIDYGYTAEEIAEGRRFPGGSLMSYQKHQAIEDVLADPGNRDLTAHVNFTALAERGEELGLTASPLVTQTRLLMELGEKDNFDAVLGGPETSDDPKYRMQLKTLLFGMGETFQVLLQRKGGPGV